MGFIVRICMLENINVLAMQGDACGRPRSFGREDGLHGTLGRNSYEPTATCSGRVDRGVWTQSETCEEGPLVRWCVRRQVSVTIRNDDRMEERREGPVRLDT